MVTYRQAQAHAQQCGIDVIRFQAVPCHMVATWRQVAVEVLHPETLRPLIDKGEWVNSTTAINIARRYGVDYIVCTR